jgi:hypothetical protein
MRISEMIGSASTGMPAKKRKTTAAGRKKGLRRSRGLMEYLLAMTRIRVRAYSLLMGSANIVEDSDGRFNVGSPSSPLLLPRM